MSTTGLFVDDFFYDETTRDIRELQESFRTLEINIPLIATLSPELRFITDDEAKQIQNINTNTISTTQWAFLGLFDQSMSTTDSVSFAELTIDQTNINNSTITFSGTTGTNCITIPEALSNAFTIKTTTESYLTFDTTQDKINAIQPLNVTNTTGSTSKDTGALIVEGGVGIEENLYTGGFIRVINTTQSTSKDTGSLVVEGGIGIEKDLFVGGKISVTSIISSTGGINSTPIGNTIASTGVFTMLNTDNIKIDGNTISSTSGGIILSSLNDITTVDSSIYAPQINNPSLPSYSFTGDIDTGMFSPGANQISFSTGGIARIVIAPDGYLRTTVNGLASTPSFSFTGDTDTGIFRSASDQLSIATGALERFRISNTELKVLVPTINTTSQDTTIEIPTGSTTAFSIKETGGSNILVFDTATDTFNITAQDTTLSIKPNSTTGFSIQDGGVNHMVFNTFNDRTEFNRPLYMLNNTINTTTQATNIDILSGSSTALRFRKGGITNFMTFDTANDKIIMAKPIDIDTPIVDLQTQATDIYLNTGSSTALEIWDGTTTGSRMMVFDTDGTQEIHSDVRFRVDSIANSTSKTTGALVVTGGVGIGGDVYMDSSLQLTDSIYIGNGSNTAPSYSFISDPDTGIYRQDPNNMILVCGGVDQLSLKYNNDIILSRNITNSDFSIKILDNTYNAGIVWENSGGAYTSRIYRNNIGGTSADLVFACGNSSGAADLIKTNLQPTLTMGINQNVIIHKNLIINNLLKTDIITPQTNVGNDAYVTLPGGPLRNWIKCQISGSILRRSGIIYSTHIGNSYFNSISISNILETHYNTTDEFAGSPISQLLPNGRLLIKAGASNLLDTAVSESSCRILHGVINSGGNIVSGSGGYTVSHPSVGQYDINFNTSFSENPTGVATSTEAIRICNVTTIVGKLTVNMYERSTGSLVNSGFQFQVCGKI